MIISSPKPRRRGCYCVRLSRCRSRYIRRRANGNSTRRRPIWHGCLPTRRRNAGGLGAPAPGPSDKNARSDVMRIFLDANILFSAAKTDGAVRELLRLLRDAGHECWIDDYVVCEAYRNLLTKGPDALSALEALVATCRLSRVQAPGMRAARAGIDWLPEKDRPVLEAAIRLRCDALLTGDRTHFGAGYGRTYAGVTIHSPRTLAEALF